MVKTQQSEISELIILPVTMAFEAINQWLLPLKQKNLHCVDVLYIN